MRRAVTVIFRNRNSRLSKTTACEKRGCVSVCVCVWFERIESKNKGLKGFGTQLSEAEIFLILEMPMVYVSNDRKIIYNTYCILPSSNLTFAFPIPISPNGLFGVGSKALRSHPRHLMGKKGQHKKENMKDITGESWFELLSAISAYFNVLLCLLS